jgi:hypothetical protein
LDFILAQHGRPGKSTFHGTFHGGFIHAALRFLPDSGLPVFGAATCFGSGAAFSVSGVLQKTDFADYI